jgi:hypothetical protein
MVDPDKLSDSLLDMLTRPPVKTLARLHPDRTIVHTIPCGEWSEEQQRQEQVFRTARHPGWEHIEFVGPAMDVLEGRLHDIAVECGINGYDIASEPNQDGDLEITMVFASPKDAMVFKMALP